MSQYGPPSDPSRAAERSLIYCMLPQELAAKLHELLRRHFADADVEVIVERRGIERRSDDDRRDPAGPLDSDRERRAVHSVSGRRFGERRTQTVPAREPELPRRARRYASQIHFVERVEPATAHAADVDAARLVASFQAGDHEAYASLYVRYFDQVYAYMRVCLSNTHEAEDATQEVFTKVFEALPGYEHREQPFRGWLFVIARNHAISRLKRSSRLQLREPELIANQLAATEPAAGRLRQLEWISDSDLMLFVERLPLPQRQALVLRYVLDLPHAEIARILDRSPEDVRALHHRALSFLRKRLAALDRVPRREGRRTRMRGRIPQAYVARARRWALSP